MAQSRGPYFQYLRNSDVSVPSSTLSDRRGREENASRLSQLLEQRQFDDRVRSPSPMEVDDVSNQVPHNFNDLFEFPATSNHSLNNIQDIGNEIFLGGLEHDIEDQDDDDDFEDALNEEQHHISITHDEDDKESDSNNVNDVESEDAEKIYPGARITKKQSNLLSMCFLIKHHLSDYALDDLIDILNLHLPEPIYTSRYDFLKNFPPVVNVKTFYYCPNCLGILPCTDTTLQVRCELCDKNYLVTSLKQNGHYFIYIPMKPQLINKLSGPLFHCLKREPDDESVLSDVTSGSIHTGLRKNKIISNYDISLQWNADGVQSFKSSKVSMCPIQAAINEFDYRTRKENIILVGLWASTEKPKVNLYMKPFVEELNDLHENGFECLPPGFEKPVHIKVHTILAPVDSVERCALQNMHQYNGEYGCSFCLHKGERVEVGNGYARVYPGEEGKKRTEQQLERHAIKAETQNIVVKGVKGVSILLLLSIFSIIKCLPPEYMHCILLGVVKLFLTTWLDSKNSEKQWYLGTKVHVIDSRLKAMLPPTEISRTPQSILNICQWKASEFKNFVQYYSLAVLKDILPEDCYQHWSLLVYAINIFNSDTITEQAFDQASKALRKFVTDIEGLYGGIELLKFNVHLLLHIPESVRRFGALWAWSAFPFESYNYVLRNMLHSSQAILQQICKSYLRYQSIKFDDTLLGHDCCTEATALYLKMMQNYRQRTGKVSLNDNRLILFGQGTVLELNQQEKSCIQTIFNENIETMSVRYDRFIFKNVLHHSCKYTKMFKRNNTCISTKNGMYMQIIGLFCVVTSSNVKKYVVLGNWLRPAHETLCINEEFSSNSYMCSIEKTNCIVGIRPSLINKKCILLTYQANTFVMELINSMETE